jgi:hypothetical protein
LNIKKLTGADDVNFLRGVGYVNTGGKMGFKIVINLKKMGIKLQKFELKHGEKIRKWREYSGYCDTWEPVAPLGQPFAACYYTVYCT